MKKILLIIITINVFVLNTYAQDAEELYTSAQEFYRDGPNELAIERFTEFIAKYPNSNKVDDSKWYLGRLNKRIGNIKAAEEYFREVLATTGSNRNTEAFYDLGKILDNDDREDEILLLTADIYPDFASDSYALRSLETVFKSYYLVGLRYKTKKLGAIARNYWIQGLELADSYDTAQLDSEYAEVIERRRILFLLYLADISPDEVVFNNYINLAETGITKYESDYSAMTDNILGFNNKLEDVKTAKRKFNYNLKLAGLYNGMVTKPGFFADLNIGLGKELNRNIYLKWGAGYTHNSFDFKTFNFDPGKTGEEQYFEWTEKISTDISLLFGSKYFFSQTWKLNADITFAEDQGDYNYGTDLYWDLAWSLPNKGILNLNNTVSLSFFPDYTNAGRELNNINLQTNPAYTFVFTPDVNFTLGYLLGYKYYFNAHYDTLAGGADPDSRSYLTNEAQAYLEFSPVKPLTFGLGYNFTFLKSFNYDLLVYGNPANQFVEDYFDYLLHKIELGIGLKSGRYSGDLSVGVGIRNFLNYPARDNTKTFIDEFRKDINVTGSINNSFELIDNKKFGKLSLILDAIVDYSLSNHEYETTYKTNYLNWQILLGVEWKD